jgi:hypothetical protein
MTDKILEMEPEEVNDQLRARIYALEETMKTDIRKTGVNHRLQEALDQSPAQNLNDMKADAILSIKNSGVGFSVQCSEFDQEWVYSHDDIDDHADNVRLGEK